MMAPEYYIFTGRIGEVIPRHVKRVRIDKSLKVVPAWAFFQHPNIEEVECHDGVEKIEEHTFYYCPNLRRVIMPGVKIIERYAFGGCQALNYIECGKLEIIGERAFGRCALSSVNLPSIKIVEKSAFYNCRNLTNVNFGKDLEAIRWGTFFRCRSLRRIALPLKYGIIAANDRIFQGCVKFNLVELVGGVTETIAALLLEKWKNHINEEIDAISHSLATTPAGKDYDLGVKTQALRSGIRSVLSKYIHYRAEHRRYLYEAAAILQPALPNDILFENILPFLELPSHTFEGES